MNKLFITVLNMSLNGTFVILAVCIARLLLKKSPKIISYCLWTIAGFRLIFPFSIESIFGLIPFKAQTIPPDISTQSIPHIDSGIPLINSSVSSILPAAAPATNINPLYIWITALSFIWLTGASVMLIYSAVSYIILKRKTKNFVNIQTNIYQTENIKSPFVLGFFSPKIYIPASLSGKELGYIILHEQTHIRRHDHIVKFLAYFILCIHWFNPLVWTAFHLMCSDMEMSCDECVLKKMGNSIKKDYSLSLISLATQRRIIEGGPLAFGEISIKERVKNVLTFKKPSRLIIIVTVALVTVFSLGFASNRISENNQNNRLLVHLGYTKALLTDVLNNSTAFSDDNKNIDEIVNSLPLPSYRDYCSFSLQYEPSKEININWEFSDYYDRGGNGIDPFYETIEENNAFILFAAVDGLERVNFLSYDNFDSRELNRVDSYTADDLYTRFGSINPYNMNISDLYDALGANIYLSEFYFAHSSRIYLGAEPEKVLYRNDEPGEIKNQPDGSVIWIYEGLGKVYHESPTGELEVDNPGCTAIYYFNSLRAEEDNNLTGLYATKFIYSDNYGKTYEEITEILGYPSVIKSMVNGDQYISYPLIAEYQNTNAYFILHNNKVTAEGVMYGNDYTMLGNL